MNWLSGFRRWRDRKIHGAIIVTPSAVSLETHGISSTMRWDEIAKIEVERVSTFIVESFFVILSNENARTLELDDAMEGFEKFGNTMFEMWPQIEEGWVKVFCGLPHISERTTLWIAPKNNY